jgi:hypothetical protein
MKWPWPPLRLLDIATIVFAIAIIGVVGFALMRFGTPKQWAADAFGPGWDCIPMPKGDPVCVKKINHTK